MRCSDHGARRSGVVACSATGILYRPAANMWDGSNRVRGAMGAPDPVSTRRSLMRFSKRPAEAARISSGNARPGWLASSGWLRAGSPPPWPLDSVSDGPGDSHDTGADHRVVSAAGDGDESQPGWLKADS